MSGGFKGGGGKDFNNDGAAPPDDKFGKNGDFQPPTDENDNPIMPDGSFKGDVPRGRHELTE